ncbi:hypothetical protein THRCLA_20344 [Thraustotheca clavata]|uniref:RING-type domain-containing protein n=1 Tax=Thraustotheca clavata TaxID=74557 RepID=A0A1W0A8G1_9STRA|nr:hypothetical protein THRCLA_20344 [Thraustotheca clavata]
MTLGKDSFNTVEPSFSVPVNSASTENKRFNACVDVHTATSIVSQVGNAPFTLYTFTVACKLTNTWWILQKRYSQVYKLRKTLCTSWFECKLTSGMKSLTILLDHAHKIHFPRRHLSLDDKKIVHERKEGLGDYIAYVVWLRHACQLLVNANRNDQCHAKAHEIVSLTTKFMEQPAAVEEEEEISNSTDQRKPTEDECAICMSNYDPADNDTILELTCGHSFHESCLVKWLDNKQTCPLCRNEALGGFIAAIN